MMDDFSIGDETNSVEIGPNVALRGGIKGRNNSIKIGASPVKSSFRIDISGDNNTIEIMTESRCNGLEIKVGNHVPAHQTALTIGKNFTAEGNCTFFLYNSGNRLRIGEDCMFSNAVKVRCGESPHLLFDKETGAYLDVSEGVFIGDHVWVGERAYINKRTEIASGCILAACGVATTKYLAPNCVIAGNPAKVVKENVEWVRNWTKLVEGSSQHKSYQDNLEKYADDQE